MVRRVMLFLEKHTLTHGNLVDDRRWRNCWIYSFGQMAFRYHQEKAVTEYCYIYPV